MRTSVAFLAVSVALGTFACATSPATTSADEPVISAKAPATSNTPPTTTTTTAACLPIDDCTITSSDEDVMHVACDAAPRGLDGEALACELTSTGEYACAPACIRSVGRDCDVCSGTQSFQCPADVERGASCSVPDSAGRVCCL